MVSTRCRAVLSAGAASLLALTLLPGHRVRRPVGGGLVNVGALADGPVHDVSSSVTPGRG